MADISEFLDQIGLFPGSATARGLSALALEMHVGGKAREKPVREIFALLGDRWSTLILLVLATGKFRHAALRRTINYLAAEPISQRMMTLKLRALNRDGLVCRSQDNSVPPRVDYLLTPMGMDLTKEVKRLIAWVRANNAAIEASRSAFADTTYCD